MAANTFYVTSEHDKARLSLHGDMSVCFDEAVDASFSVRLFTSTTELFILNSTLFLFRDTSGNLVDGLIMPGKPGMFVDLMFDPVNQVWYVTANNIIASQSAGGGSEDNVERPLVFATLPVLTPFDRSQGKNWRGTISANAKLGNPVNMFPGDVMRIVIQQDSVGGRTLTYDGAYGFYQAQPPLLSTTPLAVDIFDAYMTSDYTLICDLRLNYSVIRPIAYANNDFAYGMSAAYLAVQASGVDGQTVQVIRNGFHTESEGTIGFNAFTVNMRVRGVPLANGSLPELRLAQTDRPSFGKALINIEGGANVVIENLGIAGACAYTDGNGTGVLVNGGVSYVRIQGCHIVDNEDGVRSSIDTKAEFDLIDCFIEKNGQAANPINRGYSHSIYAGEGPLWRALRVTFRDPIDGHNIKTRSLRTVLNQVYSRHAYGAREIDCCDQGLLHATDSVFWKEAGAIQNNLVGIGHELVNGPDRYQEYFFVNCYFHNDVDPQRDVTVLENVARGELNTVPVHYIDCEFGGLGVTGKSLASRAALFKGPYTITLTGGPTGPRVPVGDSRSLFDPSMLDPNRMTNPAGIDLTPIESLPAQTVTNPTPPYPDVFIDVPDVPPIPSNGAGGDKTPPTVTLSVSSTNVTTEGSITLTALAADTGGVNRVEFYRNGSLFSTDIIANPYSAVQTLANADNGTLVYTAKAYDAAGNMATSTAVNVTVNIPVPPDVTPPTVTLSSSSSNVTAPGTIILTATAADNIGVTSVEFYRDGVLIGTDTTSPFTSGQTFAYADNGTLHFTAKAYDAAANSTTSTQLDVIVNIPPPDVTPPTVDISSSSASVTSDGSVTFTAVAADDVGIAMVEFYRNGVLMAPGDTTDPYTIVDTYSLLNNGTIAYTARAYDAAGNYTISTATNVAVNIASDQTPPTVTLASSSTNVTTAGNITLTATAADNVGVTSVEFYRNDVMIGTADTAAPYAIVVPVTEADNGSLVYTAKAYDVAAHVTTSAAVNVTVNIAHTEPLTRLDSTTQSAYDAAIAGASMGSKRLAAANALVAAFSPDHRLYIYQNSVLIVPVQYTGDCTVVDDGFDIYLQTSTTVDSSDATTSADLAVGTWWFELQGGGNYARVLTGTAGNEASGAELTLANNPAPGQGFNALFKFVIPRSVDGLA